MAGELRSRVFQFIELNEIRDLNDGKVYKISDFLGGGGGGTDLSTRLEPTVVSVKSSTGTDANIPSATPQLAGVMTNLEHIKLLSIETGAQRNEVKSLLVADSILTQTISSTLGNALDFESVSFQRGSVNAVSNNEFEFTKEGAYNVSFSVNLQVPSGNTGHVETWAEYDIGSGWVGVSNSGQKEEFTNKTEGVISYNRIVMVSAANVGIKVRVMARVVAGSAEAKTDTVLFGAVIPSVTLSIAEL